jgi:modification methylase
MGVENKPLKVENQTVYFMSSEKMKSIEDESITLIVTSPPYWDVRDYGGEQIGFNQSYEEYINSLNNVWKECIRVLQPNGKIAINVQPLPISSKNSGFDRRIIKDIMFDIEEFMFKQGLFLSGMIFWDKSVYINNVSWGSYPKPTNIATNTAFEHIYTFVKPGKTRKVNKLAQENSILTKEQWRHWAVRMIWDDISPVIKINQKGENTFGHVAPFPEDIPYRLIKMHTIEGEKVLDPFLGSGTTLKIARITQREGIGFEINPSFRDLIKKRIEEKWNPPFISSQYKTMSIENIVQIINSSIETTRSNIGNNKGVQFDEKEVFNSILKMLIKAKVLTKANIKRIKQIYNPDLNE